MAKIIIRAKVQDLARWQAGFEANESARQQFGLTVDAVQKDADEADTIIAVLSAESMERAREFTTSAELMQAQMEAGVIPPPTIWFVDDI